ncbi:MAG: hypothetical protein ACE5FY_00195 [Nitrospiria bacterium]
MDDLWAYPYRLGIGIFIVVGTILLTGGFVAFTAWLEHDFKKDKSKK